MDETNLVYMSGPPTEDPKLAAQQAMHSQYVLQLLQLQRRAGFLCDITINIQEKSFKAHKPLLAACSLYFRALFANCDNTKTSTLNFEKLSAKGFEVLLEYIYSGTLAINSQNSDQVLHAANCLQMTNVVETCLNFVRSSFKVTSVENGTSVRTSDGHDLPIALHGSETSSSLTPNQQPPVITPTSLQITSNHSSSQQFSGQLPQKLALTSSASQQIKPTSAAVLPKQDEVNVAEVKPSDTEHADPITQASPLINPTSETLTMIMPYFVAKNARRPTLNEVRQLLTSSQRIEDIQPQLAGVTADSMRSSIPPLIPVNVSMDNRSEQGNPPNQTKYTANFQSLHKHAGEGILTDMTCEVTAASEDARHTATRTTVDAEQSNHLSSPRLSGNSMQPFIRVTNEALLQKSPSDESSKGCAWSDDRSVANDQAVDQLKTHLSGTPCSANLTATNSTRTILVSPTHHAYPSTSPASFGSTPSIEISPVSVGTMESPSSEFNTPTKLRIARAKSLDFTKLASSDNKDKSLIKRTEDLRPASLSPKFFSNRMANISAYPPLHPLSGEQPALISAEQAASAVCALYTKEGDQKNKGLSAKGINEVNNPGQNSKTDQKRDTMLKSIRNDDADFASSIENSMPEEDNEKVQGSPSPQGGLNLIVKQEAAYTPSTSPPPEEAFFPVEQEDFSRSTTPSIATSSSHDGTVDENGVLDLSIQKPVCRLTTTPQMPTIPVNGDLVESVTSDDAKARDEALDALVMMQSAASSSTLQSPTFTGSSTDDSPQLTVGFSRKPRRSSGGQTCQWPGCGRLFRHRNIYEEHKKLHEMGVPVKQLRRCYMGARVKKTARERLDEMRSVESSAGVSHQNTEASGSISAGSPYQRAGHKRKKALAAQSKESPDRKRVTAKDRKEHIARNMPWQSQHATQATIRHSPLYSHPRGCPLTALHPVSQHGGLPLSVQSSSLINGGMHVGLLNYSSAAGPGMPALLSPGSGVAVATSSGGDHQNHSTVVEALTALGIPIPQNKRDGVAGDELVPALRPCIPGAALTSPNSGVALDRLRRSIAMRANNEASEQRIGNVPGASYPTSEKTSNQTVNVTQRLPVKPGPNSYHIRGPTCS